MTLPSLTADNASRFAAIALGHVTREYPNKLDHVQNGSQDVLGPRALHPIFYGSYDWHSCVHGYWLLARLRRRFPELPQATQIAALFDDAFTIDKVEVERAYLRTDGLERRRHLMNDWADHLASPINPKADPKSGGECERTRADASDTEAQLSI